MSKKVEALTKTTISLSCPLELGDGTILEAINVREPKVKDYRIANQQGKNNQDTEVILVARCCDLVLEDIENLLWKDYAKIQRFLFGKDNTDGDIE